jgi:hypothetical protein
MSVHAGFRAVETEIANEVDELVRFLNQHYAQSPFNRVTFADVQRLAATCPTGCAVVDIGVPQPGNHFPSRLVRLACGSAVPA